MIETVAGIAYLIVLPLFVVSVFWRQKQALQERKELAEMARSLDQCANEFRETAAVLRNKVESFPSKNPDHVKDPGSLTLAVGSLYELVHHKLKGKYTDINSGVISCQVSPIHFSEEDWSAIQGWEEFRSEGELPWAPEMKMEGVWLLLANLCSKGTIVYRWSHSGAPVRNRFWPVKLEDKLAHLMPW
jgi:hypothetical protein